MSAVTPKIFLNLLGKSGLVETSVLKESLAVLSREAAGTPVSLDQLAGHLVNAGLITEWHSGKLKAGKYKGFFLGKYKLLRLLGTGGMSTVYLAQHTIFDQRRAIKVLPKNKLSSRTYLERFYREGRAAASLNHRNIIRVYDIANDGDTHYLVMEYVEGLDIYQHVIQKGPMSITATIDYTIQTLTGLSHAHENELVHRDVKPANLLVTIEGTLKLLDLGLALFREEDSSLTVMHNERVLGTADYLSPEQAVDSHNVDLRADIYSTGCTMYYMLSGRPPFNDGTLAQRIARHQTVSPDSIKELRPECPDELVAIIQKMMEKNPDDRYQACEPLIAELRRLLEDCSVPERQEKKSPARAAMVETKKAPIQAAHSEAQLTKISDGASRGTPNPKVPVGNTSQGQSAHPPATRATTAVSSGKQATVPPSRGKNSNGIESKPEQPTRDPRRTPAAAAKQATQPVQRPNGDKPNTRAAAGQNPGLAKSAASSRNDTIKAPGISINVPASTVKPEVNPADRNLKAFVAHTRRSTKQTAIVPRGSLKNQLILLGIVFGMLLLLGIVVVIAIRLSTPQQTEPTKQETAMNVSQEYLSFAALPVLDPSIQEMPIGYSKCSGRITFPPMA